MAPHNDIFTTVLRQAQEFAETVAERTTDDILRNEAQLWAPHFKLLRDVLDTDGLVVVSRDGLQRLRVGTEALLDTMRRQHPWLAVLPEPGEDVH